MQLKEKDEPIRYSGQKVKGQGHDETKYGQKLLGSKMHLSGEGILVQWFAVEDHLVVQVKICCTGKKYALPATRFVFLVFLYVFTARHQAYL